MLSGGGLTAVETAIRFPVRLVESGPAGGAIFAAEIARQCRLDKVLSYDMGGTTAKICLIDDLKPQTNRAFEVARIYRFKKGSGLPLRIPVIEMVEIGAGGGSIARVDRLKRITVGPDSAGADPGPACYGRGGTAPTVTDADLLLGRIDPTGFSGGRMALDRAAAEAAMRQRGGRAAWRWRSSSPRSGSARSSTRTWRTPRASTRSRAARMRAAAPSSRLAVPHRCTPRAWPRNWGSTACWCRPMPASARRSGFCARRSPTRSCARHCSASTSSTPPRPTRSSPRCAPRPSRSSAAAPATQPLTETRSAFMRYRGQGHEIAVPLPTRPYRDDDAALLRDAFEDEYRRLYSRVIPGVEVEILSWVMLLSAPVPAES